MSRLDKWISPILAATEADVLLLVCDSIPDTSVREKGKAFFDCSERIFPSKRFKGFVAANDWCTLRKFEIVELEHSDPSEILDLEMERNKYGVERIVEALEAHTWPNMILKGDFRSVK